MRKKYKNINQLSSAFKSGKLKDYKLIIDNDRSWLQYDGDVPFDDQDEIDYFMDEKCDECGEWYEGPGGSNGLKKSYELLGIKCSTV